MRAVPRALRIWWPAAVQMLVIFAASSIPDLTRLPGNVTDHTGHFVGYAILGALLLRGFAGAEWRGVGWWSAGQAWAVAAVYGASDEWHQGFVHGRSPAVDDWVADVAGAGVAVAVLLLVAALRRRTSRAV